MERVKLEEDTAVFLAEKRFEGCAGQPITDDIRVTIAGQASLLTLGWKHYHFDRLKTILVYPSLYRDKRRREVNDLPSVRSGEAMGNESIVLSWRDALIDARGSRDGGNVILHEFAHILDMENGEMDGTPSLPFIEDEAPWTRTIEREMEQLRRQVATRRPTLLDPYAAESPAEFFAVAVESFFELAPSFCAAYPALYQGLSDYFVQDPAARFSESSDATQIGQPPEEAENP
jgi:Mlc titration factor MtfA (ptsG expression regulator)